MTGFGDSLPAEPIDESQPGPVELSRVQRRSRVALALVLVLLGAWTLRGFVPALVWAVILAIALWPLYRKVERRWKPGRHNILLPALFTLAVALVFLVPLVVVVWQAGHEAGALFHFLENAKTGGIPLPDWVARLPGGEQVGGWWAEHLADPSGYAELLERVNRETLFGYTRALGLQLVHRSILFGFALLTLFFLFRDADRVVAQLLRASHRAVGPHGERIGRQMVASVHGTVDGLVLVGLGEGVILGIAYAVAGVPHPTLLGAVTAIAAMIPFAAPVAFGLASVLLLAQGSVGWAAGIFALGAIVVFVADHFVRPVLIGGATRLPFLWVLLGIIGGVETWGLLGLFLGPALMAALVQLWRDWSAGDTQLQARARVAGA
ncbi:MAG TPA: AI-2E family transporter [Enterovirga sp.]|nr:AI-2E family transporter [Enterovirga sp.]